MKLVKRRRWQETPTCIRRAIKRSEAQAARAELDRELERVYLEPSLGACDGDCAWCVNPPPVDVDLLADHDPRALLGLTAAPVTARLSL